MELGERGLHDERRVIEDTSASKEERGSTLIYRRYLWPRVWNFADSHLAELHNHHVS
jgi:hypothetical protein